MMIWEGAHHVQSAQTRVKDERNRLSLRITTNPHDRVSCGEQKNSRHATNAARSTPESHDMLVWWFTP
jgi:hypothetical protein